MRSLAPRRAAAAALVAVVALAGASVPAGQHVVDPRDGTAYRSVTIGKQQWLAQNVRHAAPESWCFGDEPQDCAVNGRLYTWKAALSACPAGWRLPSDEDWMLLESTLGMKADALRAQGPRGSDQGARLRPGGESGFEAAMPGYRRPDGTYARRGERVAYWASTEAGADDAWHRDIRPDVGTVYRSPVTKTYALSVRCVRDAAPPSGQPIARNARRS